MTEDSKPHPDVVRPTGAMLACEIAGLMFNNFKWLAVGGLLYLLLFMTGCAPVIVGAATGAAVYHYQKCYRWMDTPQGQVRVNICRRSYHK